MRQAQNTKNVYEFTFMGGKVVLHGGCDDHQIHVLTLYMRTRLGFNKPVLLIQLFKNLIAGRLLGSETINALGVGDSHTGTLNSD